MAISTTLEKVNMLISYLDENMKTKNITLSNIRTDATAQDLKEVANAFQALQKRRIVGQTKVDYNGIYEN